MRFSLHVIPLFTVCLATSSAFGQAEFRRGDVNADGVVDIGDTFRSFGFFPELPCWDAADFNDNGVFNVTDVVALFRYLFLGDPVPPPPGPHTPGPDPTDDDGLSCESYEAVARQPTNDFRLDFECPVDFFDTQRELARAVVYGTLETRSDQRRAAGWSVSIGLEGAETRIVEATTDGTVAGPDGLIVGGFQETEIVDPAVLNGAGPQGPGVVSAVVLSITQPIELPVGIERIVRITLEATGGTVPEGRIGYIDGKRGRGQPVDNVILVRCQAADPELGSCDQFRLVEPVGLQIPADCNQDGKVDISDPICVLGYLFLGTPELLPCGDGSRDATGNVNLLDWHGDGALDISDAVGALRWLTLGGPGHVLADSLNPSACVPVSGCVRGPACDDG